MAGTPAAPRALEILIVEDHRDLRTTMRMLLTFGQGHVVHEAADGAEGIRLALELNPQVALVDLGLPDMDGREVARAIRASRNSGMYLIALTGHGSPEDKAAAEAAGFDMHLVKPVETDRLAAILEHIPARTDERAAGEAKP